MKIIIQLALFLIITSALKSQQKDDTLKKYDAVISFNSICCGTPSADFLRTFCKEFSNKNKVDFQVWQLGGCGREGEFKILICLSKLKASKKVKFKKALKKNILLQNSKNKTLKPSSGNINPDFYPQPSNFSNCSGEMTEWKY